MWALLVLPERGHSQLIAQQKLLMDKLAGMAPIHSRCKDTWVWGTSRTYSAAHGFQAIETTTVSTHNVSFWKTIWISPSIRKVNFFTWILMHQKALTSKNLSRRGLFYLLDDVCAIKLQRPHIIFLLVAVSLRKHGCIS